MEPPPVPGSADQVDVNIKVKEKPSGILTAGIGFSQSQGFIFNTDITQRNFFGTGKRMSFGFNNSDSNTLYKLGYKNPYYTVDGISRGFELSYRETDFDELETADYTTDTGLAEMNFGLPLSDVDRLGFALSYRYTKLKEGTSITSQEFVEEYGGVGASDATFDDFIMDLRWTRDTRNRAVFPTRGGSQSASLEVSLPGSDLEFYKLRYKHSRYFPPSFPTAIPCPSCPDPVRPPPRRRLP